MKKKLKPKNQISFKKVQLQSKKHSANTISVKSRSGSRQNNSFKLTNTKATSQRKKNLQLPDHQKMGLKKEHTVNQYAERNWKNNNVKQGRSGAFSKVLYSLYN